MSDAIMAFNMVRGRSTFFDAQIPRKTMSQSFHSSLYVGKVLEQTSSTYHKNLPSTPDSNLFLPSINYYDFNKILAIKRLYLMILVTRNIFNILLEVYFIFVSNDSRIIFPWKKCKNRGIAIDVIEHEIKQ